MDTYYNSEPNKWEKFSFVWQLNNLNIWMMNAELILFAVNISNTGARYWRVSQTDTLSAAFTLTVNSSKK